MSLRFRLAPFQYFYFLELFLLEQTVLVARVVARTVAHLSDLLRRCHAGEQATVQSRCEYGTAQISVAVANNRANQNTVCCGYKGPNALVKRELTKHSHVAELIDSMGHGGEER